MHDNKRKTTEGFIEEMKQIHGDKYDYSKVNYINNHEKICLICHEKNILGEEHGEFWITPTKITSRHDGCPKCRGMYKTTEEFVAEAKKVHGDKYDYSKSEYIGSHNKITVICPKHGEFSLTAKDHLNGNGCAKCKFEKIGERKRGTQESFLKKYHDKFGDEYDTSKVVYKKSDINICMVCHRKNALGEEHGEFWVKPGFMLKGGKCPKCQGRYKTTEIYVAEAKQVHGDKYDYSKTKFVDTHTKLCITCPEHGDFWQTPHSHLYGQGCPKCVMSHMENRICNILKENKIDYVYETNINGLLKRKSVDFYLPEHNTAIECQGGQHFYGGFNRNDVEKANAIHNKVLKRDIEKYKILKKNNITVLYFTNINDLPEDIFTNDKYNKIYSKDNFFTKEEILIGKIKGK